MTSSPFTFKWLTVLLPWYHGERCSCGTLLVYEVQQVLHLILILQESESCIVLSVTFLWLWCCERQVDTDHILNPMCPIVQLTLSITCSRDLMYPRCYVRDKQHKQLGNKCNQIYLCSIFDKTSPISIQSILLVFMSVNKQRDVSCCPDWTLWHINVLYIYVGPCNGNLDYICLVFVVKTIMLGYLISLWLRDCAEPWWWNALV